MTRHGFELSIEIFYCHCGRSFDAWDKLDAHIDSIPWDQLSTDNDKHVNENQSQHNQT